MASPMKTLFRLGGTKEKDKDLSSLSRQWMEIPAWPPPSTSVPHRDPSIKPLPDIPDAIGPEESESTPGLSTFSSKPPTPPGLGSARIDVGNGKASSTRTAFPYSQMSNTRGGEFLSATGWSEVADEDLVLNVSSLERTKQEALFEIVHNEERYVQELAKMKETFINPLLHPSSSSGAVSPISPSSNFNYRDDLYHSESSSESTDQLPPIAARFLAPAPSQTSRHKHPRSPYRRLIGNGTTTVPFPSRSHHSLPPPPRSNQLNSSTESLGKQSTLVEHSSQSDHQQDRNYNQGRSTVGKEKGMLHEPKKSDTKNAVLGDTVAMHQLPEDLRICLEAIDNGVFDGHKRLSEALRERYDEQFPLVRSLADVFVANSDIFQGYTTYFRHLERALEQVDAALSNVLTKKPHNQGMAEWQKVCSLLQRLEETACEKGESGLTVALCKPFQRLFKYPLLIQNVLFHTNPSTSEYDSMLQVVVEVESIARSIEDEKIEKEERDKTRDVLARIEGLHRVRQLAAPKPSRILIEERQYPSTTESSTKGGLPQQGTRGKSSFKRLSDVLSAENMRLGAKKDLWLVAFNDVVLLCQRVGTTSRPLVAAMDSRTPEVQGRTLYATTGRRYSHTKPRNLYKFIKIETWVIGGVARLREGVVLMEDVVRSRTQVGEAQPRILPTPDDDEDDDSGADSDFSTKARISSSYWGADKVTIQKPPIKPRATNARGGGGPNYSRESSANAKFGTRLVSGGHSGTTPRPASRRTAATPTSSNTVNPTGPRPDWNSNTSAATSRRAIALPMPKRPRNTSQTSAATRTIGTAANISLSIPSEDHGVGLYRAILNEEDHIGNTTMQSGRNPPKHDILGHTSNPVEMSKTLSAPSSTNPSRSTTPDNGGMIDTVQDLQALLVLRDPMKALLSLDVSRVPHVVTLLHSEASSRINSRYRKLCLRCLLVLVKKHHILPESLFLKHITREGTHPLRGGGFSDIWRGIFKKQSVCLKVMRTHLEANERKRNKVVAAFCKEALVWTQLNHPNVLPLLGVDTELFQPALCLVSPWMWNGDIITYLEEHPDHDRLRSVYEIASGLAYLHSLEPMVIHGDIKGANILVDDLCSCRLSDFGLAAIKESQRIASTTSGGPKGTMRWMAPELFQPEANGETDNSPKDVYAYACTVLEIMTGKPPFPDLLDAAIILKVITGERPSRPSDVWCPDKVWDLVERCWSHNPSERPRAAEIERYLVSKG
ncbi:hypothetical protein WG66_011164 [Moniliophthora roreri]|nr:hypothetical protein WG66_011164 [Moniliophthora roreri]